jgi:hypothetical protein
VQYNISAIVESFFYILPDGTIGNKEQLQGGTQ